MEYNQNLLGLALRLGALGQLMRDDNDNVGASSTRTVRTHAQEERTPQNISSLEQLFQFEEKVEKYLKNGKSEEAYEILKRRYKQGANVHFAPAIVQYYVVLMRTSRPEKAVKIRDELKNLLVENVDLSAKDLEEYGHSRKINGDLFEAILFFQIALSVSENETDANEVINVLHRCCARTAVIVEKLIEKKEASKQLVRSYIIPFMRKISVRISKFRHLNRTEVSYVQGVCLHYVEQCEHTVGDLDSRETTLHEAIALLRENLGSSAEKRHVFGGCLNNLGHTYLLQSRPAEAAKLFAQAIAAKQNAEDYDTPQEKRKDVEKSKLALSMARNGM